MTLLPALRIAGVMLLALAVAHFFFAKPFRWHEELQRLSLLNRQIFEVHHWFIALMVGMQGILLTFATPHLLERSVLGAWVAAGLCLFWVLRLIAQWFVYKRELWRGKRFETFVHIAFTGLWTYLVAVLGILWKWQLQ